MSDDEEEEAQYNNTNRAFLQAFLARSTLTFEEAKPVLAAIFTAHGKIRSMSGEEVYKGRETLPGDVTEEDFQSYVSAANTAISPFDLEIRSTYHQVSRTRTYALVNTTSDPITQLATTHTPDELAFLKRVLDAMFETYNTTRHEIMAITSTQAVQLHRALSEGSRRETQNGSTTQGSTGQGLTMVQAEKVLKGLVEEGWFERSRKGFYSLSPKGLMELRGWLIETYNDVGDEDEEADPVPKIKTCFACKEIITVGQRCPKKDCLCRVHDICTQNFFRVQKTNQCPLCRTEWTGKDYVGEKAVTTTEKYLQGKRRSRGASNARRSTQVAADESEDEEAHDDE